MKKISFTSLSLMACAVCALAACNTVPEGQGMPMPKLEYAYLQPIPINVHAVEVNPGVGKTEGHFAVDPMNAAREYFQARFAAHGGNGALQATIEEANVTEAEKPSNNKVARYFDVAGTDVYNIVLRVRLNHLDATGSVVYGKVLTAKRILNISQHASIAEREKHQVEGFEMLFHDLDKEVVRVVTEEMGVGY